MIMSPLQMVGTERSLHESVGKYCLQIRLQILLIPRNTFMFIVTIALKCKMICQLGAMVGQLVLWNKTAPGGGGGLYSRRSGIDFIRHAQGSEVTHQSDVQIACIAATTLVTALLRWGMHINQTVRYMPATIHHKYVMNVSIHTHTYYIYIYIYSTA